MCSNYIPTTKSDRLASFGLKVTSDWVSPANKLHIYPTNPAPFITIDVNHELQLNTGEFGLIPRFSQDGTSKYSTFNARTETVAKAPTFRSAWANRQRCIIPCDVFFEPDWRTGKCIWTGFRRSDNLAMGVAGLWDKWINKSTGEFKQSFTMLTINASQHALMRNYHKPNDEKRMVVILEESQYQDWLMCSAEQASSFFTQYQDLGTVV